MARLKAFAEAASQAGLPLGDLALAWALDNPAIACTLAGARTRAQGEANVRAAELPLAPALRANPR